MNKKYLYWNKDLKIENHNTVRSKLYIDGNKKKIGGFHQINNSAKDIIMNFDGMHTYSEVCNKLMEKYNDTYENVDCVIKDFLSEIKKYEVFLIESDSPIQKKCILKGEKTIYPEAVSIELTEKCNLQCIHCYGEFGPDAKIEMSLSNVKKLLKDLKKIGVMIIELTGGDITMYPHTLEVVRMAVEMGFSRISLLTNGVALKKEVMDYVIEHKDVCAVQIDLHSLKNDYYYWFTKSKNGLEKVKQNIEYLSQNNVLLRVVTIVTKKNLDEMEEIANWVQERGAFWNTGLSERVGRADNSSLNDLYLDDDEKNKYFETLLKLREKNKKLGWLPPEEERTNEHNCGVLTTHTVISSSGRVKLCTMEQIPEFELGNVFHENIKDIFNKNVEFLRAFALQETPRLDAKECAGCEYQFRCAGCILQNLLLMKNKNFECDWYRSKKMNPLIIEKIFGQN